MHIARMQNVVFLFYIWISVPCVVTLSEKMQKAYDSGCLSMTHNKPWKTEVDVDRFIFKDYYRKGKRPSMIDDKLMELSGLFRVVQSTFNTNTRGIVLIIEKSIPDFAISEIVSYFLCNNDNPKPHIYPYKFLAFHICKSEIGQTQKTALFVRNIAGKLANEIPEIRNHFLAEKIQMLIKKTNCAADLFTCIDNAIIKPLRSTNGIPKYKHILLVSGLDECGHMVHGNHTTIPKLLELKINDFPSWTKFLFISRNEQMFLKSFPDFQKHVIKEKDLQQTLSTYTEAKSETNFDSENSLQLFSKPVYYIEMIILVISIIILCYCLYPEKQKRDRESSGSFTIHYISSNDNERSVQED